MDATQRVTMPCTLRSERATVRSSSRERAAAIAGCFAVTIALAIIWMARLSVPRELYVSELGAEGEPTAR